MDNTHKNYIKIHYSGRDYIGQIRSIDSVWIEEEDFEFGEPYKRIGFYKVCIYEKDTFCVIGDIYIHDMSEIKPYEDEDISNG